MPLRMEVNNRRPEILVGKTFFGGLVRIRKRSKSHCMCVEVSSTEKGPMSRPGAGVLALRVGKGGRGGLQLSPLAYHYPDQG